MNTPGYGGGKEKAGKGGKEKGAKDFLDRLATDERFRRSVLDKGKPDRLKFVKDQGYRFEEAEFNRAVEGRPGAELLAVALYAMVDDR